MAMVDDPRWVAEIACRIRRRIPKRLHSRGHSNRKTSSEEPNPKHSGAGNPQKIRADSIF